VSPLTTLLFNMLDFRAGSMNEADLDAAADAVEAAFEAATPMLAKSAA
jgi:hypothetical protein